MLHRFSVNRKKLVKEKFLPYFQHGFFRSEKKVVLYNISTL